MPQVLVKAPLQQIFLANGRIHSKEESELKYITLKELLKRNNVSYKYVTPEDSSSIIQDVAYILSINGGAKNE